MEPSLYGGIEAGGTKFVCLVAGGPQDIREEIRFPTTTPGETLGRTLAFFEPYARRAELRAIGVGAFGPVDLNPSSPTYGYVTTTPKPGWAQTDVAGRLQAALGVPVAFDTDVNVACLGEHVWVPANRGLDPFLYITIGTGIGMGGIVNGMLLHGLVHPEAGHMRVPHDWQADPFSGACPFHGDCFEGLAAGPALDKRWGQRGETLPPDHPAWALEAVYVAQALTTLICTLSPQRIVLGGGVMGQPGILPVVRQKTQALLNGYVQSPAILEYIDEYIVAPGLPGRSGTLGAIALAMQAAGEI